MTARAAICVLLVEDEPKLRESLVEGLRLEEWTVIGAATAAEALERIAASKLDLIVLDWMLPDGDGLEIVQRLRARGNDVPLLLITARGGRAAKEAALHSGANDYLAKPFSFDDLIAHCRALVAPER